MKKEIIGAVVVLAILILACINVNANNRYFTKNVKAEIIDTEETDLVFVKYNDVEYVVIDAKMYNRCKDNIGGRIDVVVEIGINSKSEKIIAVN